MPRIEGTTNQQTKFLRAYRTHPHGPPAELWPSPAIFRKWMRSYAFQRALNKIKDALRYQADIHLATAANRAALSVTDPVVTEDADPRTAQMRFSNALNLIRLSHIRQRFHPDEPLKTIPQIFDFLRAHDPRMPVGIALACFKKTYPTLFEPDDDLFDLKDEDLTLLLKQGAKINPKWLEELQELRIRASGADEDATDHSDV